MEKEKSKRGKILVIIGLILILILVIISVNINSNKDDFVSVSSQNKLKIVSGQKENKLKKIAALPFSLMFKKSYGIVNNVAISNDLLREDFNESSLRGAILESNDITNTRNVSVDTKDYSKTNIQVENVDEADVIKTDGDYIYHLSGTEVIITNVKNEDEIKVEARINLGEGVPEELVIYNNMLIVISSESVTGNNRTPYYSTRSMKNTLVNIVDISNKENPKIVKKYELYEQYYTTRLINSRIYVLASGKLRTDENDDIITIYSENSEEKEIGLKNIRYLKNQKSNNQTLISMVDLNDLEKDITVNSYLIDLDNAYITTDSMYLVQEEYESSSKYSIKDIFGIKGIFGLDDKDKLNIANRGYKTNIYKYNLLENGEITYQAKTKVEGKTINQFSLDEYNGYLRVALYDENGTRVVVFHKDSLEEMGRTDNMAKGEKMYSARFVGDKAYLVTFKVVDPLFVVDLSIVKYPQVLGELKIPGYSTYLHPYDENHIIGIGMETKEVINRDFQGSEIFTTSNIVGMKMALFDVSDVNNPKELTNIVIGDRRTTSAILTNHKALLFSKEKGIMAIPVNNLAKDLEISQSDIDNGLISSRYISAMQNYISEGYLVYDIGIENGFELKGMITHEQDDNNISPYNRRTRLLRGMYIDDNLYTVSEDYIKIHNLEELNPINELKI